MNVLHEAFALPRGARLDDTEPTLGPSGGGNVRHMIARRSPVLALVLTAAALAGCGQSERPTTVDVTPSPRAAARVRASELLWFKRVTATPDPVADDLSIGTDGQVLYRLGLGGRGRGVAEDHLSPARLERLRTLIARAHLKGRRQVAPTATRGGFYYNLRVDGTTYATASGHLPAAVRPLVETLDRLVLRLTDKVRFPLTLTGRTS